MKNHRRNLLFLLLSSITFSAALGLYLKLSSDDTLFMSLIIIDGVLLAIFMFLMIYDTFSANEEKYDQENRKAVVNERHRHRSLSQQKLLNEEDIGKHIMHTHYAFENMRNSWRSLLIAVVHIFIFSSLIVYYVKLNSSAIEIIVALIFGVLALTIHVFILLYNLYLQYYHKEYREPIEMIRNKKNIRN